MKLQFKWPFLLLGSQDEVTKSEKEIIKNLRAKGINTPNQMWDYLMPEYSDPNNSSTVTKQTALTLSAVYAALNISANSLNVPINVYHKDGGKREVVTDKYPYEYQVQKLLHSSPNRMMTPSTFFQLLEWNRLIYGNGYAEIIRNGATYPTALKWIHPNDIRVKIGKVELYYEVIENSEKTRKVRAMDMIHVKNGSLDGYTGVGVIDIAAESLGFGKALQRTGNKFFDDGMTNKVLLSHPGQLKEAGRKNLQTSFDAEMKEKSNIILEEGIKATVLSITPAQSEFLKSREFSVTEVARWFGLPDFMLANNDPTYSNIENFGLYFTQTNLRPKARIYEQELNWKLLTNYENFYTEYELDSLLRADLKSQAEYFVSAIQNGWMSRNEVRSKKNLNAVDGLDEMLTPLNLATEKERNENNNNNAPKKTD